MNQAGTYWYLITLHYCPVCGASRLFRERQYSKKPERWEERHVTRDFYDWCLEREGLR